VSTSLIAMSVALFLVLNLVVGLGALSLLFGTFETLFGKPKLTLLRATKSGNYFAFFPSFDFMEQVFRQF
jgi:hypothetical protein